jgi:tetratricopeptide (TPR) repeat protein
MFNINIYLLISLIAVFLLGGIVLSFTVNFWYAFPVLLVGIVLVLVYIFFGSVNSAAKYVQSGDFDKAEKILSLTMKPNWLYVTQRAFYYIMKGAIAMNNKEMKEAELLFDHALHMNLPSDNEKGMVLLQLANINGSKGKWNAAKKYFREAKKLKITESQIKDQLSMFERALANSGQVKAARSMGKQGMQMMQGGGKSKRRRPKMR